MSFFWYTVSRNFLICWFYTNPKSNEFLKYLISSFNDCESRASIWLDDHFSTDRNLGGLPIQFCMSNVTKYSRMNSIFYAKKHQFLTLVLSFGLDLLLRLLFISMLKFFIFWIWLLINFHSYAGSILQLYMFPHRGDIIILFKSSLLKPHIYEIKFPTF